MFDKPSFVFHFSLTAPETWKPDTELLFGEPTFFYNGEDGELEGDEAIPLNKEYSFSLHFGPLYLTMALQIANPRADLEMALYEARQYARGKDLN